MNTREPEKNHSPNVIKKNGTYKITNLKQLFKVIEITNATAVSFDIDGTLLGVRTISMVLAEAAVKVLGKDGCLLDDHDGRPGAFTRAMESLGKVKFGNPYDQIKIFQPTLKKGKQLDFDDAEEIIQVYEANFQEAIKTGRFNESVYPDTLETLNNLDKKNIKILIHSGRYTHLSNPQLASIGLKTTENGGLILNIAGGNQGDKKEQIKINLKKEKSIRNPSKNL